MSEKNNSILSKFPKKRIELPEAYKKIYAQHYLINREGKSKTTSLSKKLEHWLHKQVAKDTKNRNERYSTLSSFILLLEFNKHNFKNHNKAGFPVYCHIKRDKIAST